jgi:uncharacterized protein (TIGR03437 family)
MGSGTTLTLSGAASATATADASGNYTFTGLKNGAYTVAAARSGYTLSPASQPVTIAGGNIAGIGFTISQIPATSSILSDVGVWRDQSTAGAGITSPSFSTHSSNELLLAFIATDYRSGSNVTVRSVSGAGLKWVLAVRANVQRGTAEIWRAFATAPLNNASVSANLSEKVAASITVVSFTGADPSGAVGVTGKGSGSSGAPSATLITTRINSLVMGVGTDYKSAISRTSGSGQSLVHQYLNPGGASFWVQAESLATPLSGTSVTMNDSAPTTDPYNLSIIEILAAPATTVSGATPGSVATSAERNTIASSKGEPATQQLPGFTLANVATGLEGDACSPGGLASIVGFTTPSGTEKAETFPLPTKLAGVRVRVNDAAAPLLFVSGSQINFQCPWLDVGTSLKLSVENETGVLGQPILSTMQRATPGLFMVNATNQGVVQIGTTNQIAMAATEGISSRPARPAEMVTIYASGLGEVTEDVSPGEPAPLDRPILLKNKVTAVVGGSEIEPDFAGLAPGAAGLYQLRLRLPAEVTVGDSITVYLKVTSNYGSVIRSNSVKIAIQQNGLQQ